MCALHGPDALLHGGRAVAICALHPCDLEGA